MPTQIASTGFFFHGVADHIAYIEALNFTHAVANRTDAGKHHSIGIFNQSWI